METWKKQACSDGELTQYSALLTTTDWRIHVSTGVKVPCRNVMWSSADWQVDRAMLVLVVLEKVPIASADA